MITARLVSKVRSPYGGRYTWKDPMLPKSQVLAGNTWEMLVRNAKQQRFANGIAMGLGFEEEIEKDVCRDYPNECNGFDPAIPRPRSLTMLDVVRGSQVWATQKIQGNPLVIQEEAYRRAKICSLCPLNVTFTKRCGACMDLEKMAATMINNASTPYDNSLKSCSICHCYTRVAVWIPLENQCGVVTSEMREQFASVPNCWKQCP